MTNSTFFQYCQKLVVIDRKTNSVLLARRKGEADYDGVYSLIGGKMETTDGGIVEGMRREKEEEIGKEAVVHVAADISYNVYFKKKDGSSMILPHYYAEYHGGEIAINEEYSDYKWVKLDGIDAFEPKIETIPEVLTWAIELGEIAKKRDSLVKL
jgi:ADP-ribose pyrophosphatase YjhB (NUDIX family)